jgi:hypothetical protein
MAAVVVVVADDVGHTGVVILERVCGGLPIQEAGDLRCALQNLPTAVSPCASTHLRAL